MTPVGTQSIWKSSTRLADGREIVYFDEAPGLGRAQARDTRPLPPRPPGPALPHGSPDWGIRWDTLAGEWVVIAAARQDRTFLPPADQCPLDPSAPGRPTEIPADSYDVVVFENRFPSLAEPLGRCEVVCFTSDHSSSFAALSPRRVRTVLEAWADRTEALSALPGTRQVYCFENRGEEIGVTLHHPHGQVYAFPYVPPRTRSLLAAISHYGPGLMQDILDFERKSDRKLIETEHFTVFVPFAARWPIEVHMLAHRQVPDLAATTGPERDEIAVLYPRILAALDRLYDTPTPYIAAWHQAPVHQGRADIRLMLQVTSPRRAKDKLKYTAGSETGMGAFIGDVVPEVAAARLREALDGLR